NGVLGSNVFAQGFELVFGTLRGKVSDLRLEATRIGRRGIDDVATKLKNRIGFAVEFARKTLGIRIQADLQQCVASGPGLFELLNECHRCVGDPWRSCREGRSLS